MRSRFASLADGRTQLRLPLSPVRAGMALKALQDWRQPEDQGRERHWYQIGNTADGAPTQVNIFDEISWWGISAQEFCDEIAGISGDLEIHINSPGGDAFDGITIYNALAARGKVTTVVDGLAASAASVIAMAGQQRVMSPGSMMMIHDALALCIGNAADMRDTAGLLDKVSDNIASVYAAATTLPAAHWRQAMVAEGWYTAQEAVTAGLAHKIAERPAADSLAAWSSSAAVSCMFARWQGRPAAASHPMTGSHTHAHPAYDGPDPDGDGQHGHEHSHDGDSDHDHDHDQPGARSGRHFRNAGADDADDQAGIDEFWNALLEGDRT